MNFGSNRSTKMIVLLLSTLVVSLFQSCSSERVNTTMINDTSGTAQREWSVMYYGVHQNLINADSTARLMVEDIAGFEKVPTSDKISLHALYPFDSTGSNSVQYCNLKFHPMEGIQSRTTQWQNSSITAVSTLQHFIDSVVTQYPARHYALIIAGNGKGLENAFEVSRSTGTEVLQLADIKNGIAGSLVHRFDVVILATSGLAHLETGYELRNVAETVVATNSQSNSVATIAPAYWVNDLIAQPAIDGVRLSRIIVDGLYRNSWTPLSTQTYCSIITTNAASLVSALDSLSIVMTNRVGDHAQTLNALRSSAWSSEDGDSTSIDCKKYCQTLLNSPEFRSDSVLLDRVRSFTAQLEGSGVYRRPVAQDVTNAVNPSQAVDPMRAGISMLYARHSMSQVLAQLDFNRDHPSWSTFVNQCNNFETAHSITVTGTIRGIQLPVFGEILRDLYLFMDTTSSQRPTVLFNRKLDISDEDLITINDTTQATFTVRIPVPAGINTIRTRVWGYQDLNRDSLLNTGDRYGFNYTTSRFIPSVYTVSVGDTLQNKTIGLTYNY